MGSCPEIQVTKGPGAGKSIPLADQGQTYTIGGEGCDLHLPGIAGRMVFRVERLDPPLLTLVAAVGLEVDVLGTRSAPPRLLGPGDTVAIAGTGTELVVSTRTPTEIPDDEADDSEHTVLLQGAPKPPEHVLADDEATTMLDRDRVDEIVAAAMEPPVAVPPAVPSPDMTVMASPLTASEIRAGSDAVAREEGWAPTREIGSDDASDATVLADRTVFTPRAPAPAASREDEPTIRASAPPAREPEGGPDDATVHIDAVPFPPSQAPTEEQAVPVIPAPTEEQSVPLAPTPTAPIPRTAPMTPPPAAAAAPPTRPEPVPRPGGSGGAKLVVVGVVVMLLVAIGGAVGVVMWAPWKSAPPRAAPTSPEASPSPATVAASASPATAPPSAGTAMPSFEATAAPPATPVGPAIVRVEPPSAPPGATVLLEVTGVPDDAQVFFGPTVAKLISREGGAIRVEVPNLGSASSAPITIRTASGVATNPRDFTVEVPALPAVTFRYEMRPDGFAGGPLAMVYLGPIPLFAVASKGSATSVEERARLASLDLDAARTLLASNSAASLKIVQGRRTWDVVAAEPAGPPLAVLCSVGPEEVAYLGSLGKSVVPEILAGYWMSILHDSLAVGFGVGRLERLPEDSPGGAVLRRMTAGGLAKGFAALSPEDRHLLESLSVDPPPSFASFDGGFRGLSKLERAAFPEIRWPRVELEIQVTFQSSKGLKVGGELALTWISSLDDTGLSKSSNKLGTFPIQGTIDASNLNTVRFTIQHAGVSIPFQLTRTVDPVTKAPRMTGRYAGTTDFELKKL